LGESSSFSKGVSDGAASAIISQKTTEEKQKICRNRKLTCFGDLCKSDFKWDGSEEAKNESQ
jgi:hypothetical protein